MHCNIKHRIMPSFSMAIREYPKLLFLFACLIFLYLRKVAKSRSHIPLDWPILGMIPSLLRNAHRVHDFTTDVLKESRGTFYMKGPWFANMDMLVTSDPANVHYILSKNFSNYPKGPQFRKMFDILGDGIFNADSELWEFHRKTTLSLFNHPKFSPLLERTIWNTVEDGLLPVLEFVSRQGIEADLQDILQRYFFDGICKMFLDNDPKSLSIDFPHIPCERAFTMAEEALLYRHILPEKFWKLQQWLHIGHEKKLSEAWKTFDQFIYKCITLKQENLIGRSRAAMVDHHEQGQEEDFDLLTTCMEACKDMNGNSGDPKQFLRDTLLSLMLAGRDSTSLTLTWFFYLLAKNPSVKNKIREEIDTKLQLHERGKLEKRFGMDKLRNMVYLHGALCETLRLFPPISLDHKAPDQPDILPSGHVVDHDTKIILSFYSMGRMESIWGKDCMEFKPERWISEKGGIKHEPTFKFTAFNSGPRTCLGKEIAFTQLKMVATRIIQSYHVEVLEGHPVSPSNCILLQMKYGLKVKLTKRSGDHTYM